MIKTILLYAPLHATKSEQGPAAAALALAAWTSAKVTALLFDYHLPGRPSTDPQAAAEALEARSAQIGVTVEAITSHSHAHGIHEVVADHARVHDLVVAGSDGYGLLPERQVSEYLLFESGRPMLIVPAPAGSSTSGSGLSRGTGAARRPGRWAMQCRCFAMRMRSSSFTFPMTSRWWAVWSCHRWPRNCGSVA